MVLNADCFARTVEVQAPLGQVVATIERQFGFFIPSFHIKDPSGQVMFKVASSSSAFFGRFRVDFKIKSHLVDPPVEVGKISKQWGGLMKEFFTNMDIFGIQFPADMEVQWKAVLLAVLFHIDFSYYEHR